MDQLNRFKASPSNLHFFLLFLSQIISEVKYIFLLATQIFYEFFVIVLCPFFRWIINFLIDFIETLCIKYIRPIYH